MCPKSTTSEANHRSVGKRKMKRLKDILTLFFLLSIVALEGHAQSTQHSKSKSLMGIEVHFRFDDAQLDLGYMGNTQSLDRFAHVIDSIGLNKIDSVVIVSQSSPEGVYEHNLKLSRRRAATMRSVVEQRHPELGNRLHVHPDGESWERLREYVKNDTLMKQSTIDKVIAIIDSDVNAGTKKWRMEQLPIYRYLRTTYYPRIRNSVFCVIYYDIQTPMARIEEPVTTTIQLPHILKERPFDLHKAHRKETILSLKSNLLYDLGTILNIGIEYYPRNSQWSFLADYTFPWWSHDIRHHYLQLINGSLEARRYFDKQSGHTGHYLSAYGHANLYDLSFDAERGWQGEGWGLGLGYGYVWHPWKNEHWKLEAFVRLGYYHSLYDPYHASDPYNGKYYYDWDGPIENFIRRNHRLRWLGPTGAGITISYDLFKRKLKTPNSKH